MKTLGIIGGIGPESTVDYYHRIIALYREKRPDGSYPSILINKSGTRREELLLKPEILQKTWILRKLLYPMDEIEAMEFILDKMKASKNNLDFFDMMRRGG